MKLQLPWVVNYSTVRGEKFSIKDIQKTLKSFLFANWTGIRNAQRTNAIAFYSLRILKSLWTDCVVYRELLARSVRHKFIYPEISLLQRATMPSVAKFRQTHAIFTSTIRYLQVLANERSKIISAW